MAKKILIPFVAGIIQPDNAETRSRLQEMLNYIKSKLKDEEYLILLSGGGHNKSLAVSLREILGKMGFVLPDDRFLYEELSWDTTTQVQYMTPIIKLFDPQAELLVFSNRQHLARIGLIFSRYGFKIKKYPSSLGYKDNFYRLFYVLVYEPIMYILTLLYLDKTVSIFTRNRLKSFNRTN